ncbi:glycosyltransferase [Agaribacter marinus]|uniref:Glycosyl transferase n=1 Tax=Agaribacter marinus TaxID=1431249 RepID=A0AA37T4B7_9ALTE|nr:glycosyltransferase [Agaribacter marinus]GLR72879.1 glycosyl transferase [Agaribacter marinus]
MANIAIVLHDLRGGGAEKMMVRLANQLADEGDVVNLILITSGGINKRFLQPNVNLIELNCKRTLSAFKPLRTALKKIRPEGILAALTHINVITAIVCYSLGWSKKLSVSERNAFSLDKNVNTNAVMKAAYFLAPFVYRALPNPVIAVSKGVASDLVESTITRDKDVTTAPNPVVIKETIDAAKAPPSHKWLVNKSLPTIIAVGRLTNQKGFDMLLDAFYQVNKSLNCRLIIFGEGELREQLESHARSLGIEDRVSLPGYTANPLAEMKAADLYVLSSRFEGSPNAIVEAMSVSTAVVAFDCPHGAREILQDGKVAPLVEYMNVEKLSAAIVHELQTALSPDYSAEIKKFTAQAAAKSYRKLIIERKSRNQ